MSVQSYTFETNITQMSITSQTIGQSVDTIDGRSDRSPLMISNGCPLVSEAISSPLEVLSSAAALIEKANPYDDLQTKFTNTIKELPTKENKMKRNKDRRELAHSSSFKIKTRSSSPPTDDPMIADRAEHSLSPNFSPSSMAFTPDSTANTFSNALSTYSTYIGFGQRTGTDPKVGLLSSYRGSPYHHIDGTNSSSSLPRRNSDPNSQQSTHSSSDSLIEDEDKPLDMSNKKYRNPESTESQSSSQSDFRSEPMVLSQSPTHSPQHSMSNLFGQQMRPSVITCASSLMKSQRERDDTREQSPSPVQSLPPPPSYNCQNCSTQDVSACKRHRTRQVIVTEEVSDPVIDEHFRRSLGKDYSQIFSNSTNNNSITYSVDDHFAKALGDTWVRLQKTANGLDGSAKANSAQSITS